MIKTSQKDAMIHILSGRDLVLLKQGKNDPILCWAFESQVVYEKTPENLGSENDLLTFVFEDEKWSKSGCLGTPSTWGRIPCERNQRKMLLCMVILRIRIAYVVNV